MAAMCPAAVNEGFGFSFFPFLPFFLFNTCGALVRFRVRMKLTTYLHI